MLSVYGWAEPTISSEEDAFSAAASLESSQTPDASAANFKPDPDPFVPVPGSIPSGLTQLGLGQYFSPYAIVVDKSARTLSVWRKNNNQIVFVTSYATDLGRVPGDKMVLGDLKTPEGIYFFEHMYEGRQLNFEEYGVRAFTMDYPNFFDRRDRKTGSGIWLHGIPDTTSLWRGSRGCVVIRNEHMDEIQKYIALGRTPIIVEEKTTYIDPARQILQSQQMRTWLENWRRAWESKDLETYMSFYHPDFESSGMNRRAWRAHKKSLNERYEFIRVGLFEPQILGQGERRIIRFVQAYESDHLSDFGEKTLYLEQLDNGPNAEPGPWAIVGETWKPIHNQLLAQQLRANAQELTR